MAADVIRVLVVDDQGVIRAGLRMIVDNEDDMVVVGDAANGADAVRLTESEAPHVVLMDIRMPELDGLDATRQIAARGEPAPAVLILTTFDDEEYVLGAVRAGAAGFLLKDAGPDMLVSAIRSAYQGDSLIDPTVTRTLIARCLDLEERLAIPTARPARNPWTDRLATLSEREREILVALASGLSNRELAQQLVVTETTVKSHVSNVLTKLGLQSRVQAVVVAYEAGIVSPGDDRKLTWD